MLYKLEYIWIKDKSLSLALEMWQYVGQYQSLKWQRHSCELQRNQRGFHLVTLWLTYSKDQAVVLRRTQKELKYNFF